MGDRNQVDNQPSTGSPSQVLEGSSARIPQQNGFQEKAVNSTPKVAIAFCGILISLSLAFRIMGLDVSTPLNRYMAAKSLAIELQVESQAGKSFEEERLEMQRHLQEVKSTVEELNRKTNEVQDSLVQKETQLNRIEADLQLVKEVAHKPKGQLIFK